MDSREPVTDTTSEAYRHQCEVRFILAMPTNKKRKKYIDGVREKRNDAAADRLYNDVKRAMR